MTVMVASFALLLSFGMLCAGRFPSAVAACVMQAVLAAVALAETTMAAALVAVALNGVALPLAMQRHSPGTVGMRGNAALAWCVVVVLLVTNVLLFAQFGPGEGVTLGASVVLLGFVIVVLRMHPMAPALGLLSSQNGLVLVASALPALHPLPALIIAMPLVPAMVLADAWLRR